MWQHLAAAFALSAAESSSTLQNCLVTQVKRPWFEIEMVFLLSELVLFLGSLPPKSDADSEICVGSIPEDEVKG